MPGEEDRGEDPPRAPPRMRRTTLFSAALLACVCAVLVLGGVTECRGEASLVSESETKTIEPTNNPTKVFIRRRIFRKLVKEGNSSSEDGSTTTTTTTLEPPGEQSPSTTSRPRTLYSLVKRLDSSGTVSGKTIKSSISSQSQLPKPKFNFQSLKTRLGLAADSQSTTASPPPSTTTGNSSMVMIPLPPSQRKPYTPVIMQVSKSTTASPETTVHTYKLNKMFVPIGIYGKVVENGTGGEEEEQVSSTASSTPIPSIRHKGTDSGEKKTTRKHKGIAETVDLTYSYKPKVQDISLTTQRVDVGQISITTDKNELFDSVYGANNVRRGDNDHWGATNNRFSSSSGMSLMKPPSLGTPAPGTYPTRKVSPSSIVDSITDSMSRIPSLVPSLFHKGLTSLASMTSSMKENPFVDENFSDGALSGSGSYTKKPKPLISTPSSYSHKIPASVPGGYISMSNNGDRNRDKNDQYSSGSEQLSSGGKDGGNNNSPDYLEYETLEYFRKRPYLLQQAQEQIAQMGGFRRSRLSKGFKPVNAPEYLAREYYKSTTSTTSIPKQVVVGKHNRAAKKLAMGDTSQQRASWLMRNSDEYVASKNDRLVRMWRGLFDSMQGEDPQSTQLSNRRSILSAQWTDIQKKYSKDQIDEAKERILTLLNSGYGDEALDHELLDDDQLQGHHHHEAHMQPPLPLKALSLTKGLSSAAAGAFKDLLKFFKLGVSVGTGQSHGPVNYEDVVDHQEEHEHAGGSEWKPIVRRPLISFSAGISVKNPLSSSHGPPAHPPRHHYHHEQEGDHESTHFSSSSKPYIPTSYRGGLKSYMDEFAVSHGSGKPAAAAAPYSDVSYVDDGGAPPPQSLDYDHVDDLPVEEPVADIQQDDVAGYGSEPGKAYAAQAIRYNNGDQAYDSTPQYSYKHYSTLKPSRRPKGSSSSKQVHMNTGDLHPSDSNWKPLSSGDFELIPSDVYLNTPHDPRDIAAVVKPAGVSDDVVRSSLPAGLRDLPTLNYPNEYAYSNSLNSISQQILGGGGGGSNNKVVRPGVTGTTFKHAMKKLRDNYEVKEAAYLPLSGSAYETQNSEQVVKGGYYTGGGGAYAGLGLGQLTSAAAGLGLAPSGLGSLSHYSPYSSGGRGVVPQQHSLASLIGSNQFVSGGGHGQVLATANHINNNQHHHHQQHQIVGFPPQKDSLGFTSNYNLPSSLDPDIAAILKSELDKDDIPEDVRNEFLEAKREEEAKKAKQQQRQQQQEEQLSNNNRRVDVAQQTLINSILSSSPTFASISSPAQSRAYHPNQYNKQQYHQQYHHQHHQFGRIQPQAPPPVVMTKFFAPIPITPTLMTTAIRNPRYQSPVPRYVIELAKKLQTDKSVQGIVRVSAKRGRGLPPIEYLYPVKG